MVTSMTRFSWVGAALRHCFLEFGRNLSKILDEVATLPPDVLRVRAELVEPRLSLVPQVLDLFLGAPQLLRGLDLRISDDPLGLGSRLHDVCVRLGFRIVGR